MLVDIVNEQVLNAEIHIIVISNRYDKSVLSSLDGRVGVTYINRPVSSRNPWYLIKLHWVVRRLKPNVLHSQDEHIIDTIPFRKAPIVATIHDTGLTLPTSIRKHEGIFAISEAVKQEQCHIFKVEPEGSIQRHSVFQDSAEREVWGQAL